MLKNKKVIIIATVCVLISLVLIGIIFAICKNKIEYDKEEILDVKPEDLKSLKLYEKLIVNKDTGYTITMKIDNDNKTTIVVKGDKAYQEELSKGEITKYIVKDGNTYLLSEKTKKYYTYQNNSTILSKITNALDYFQGCDYIAGTEKIDGKKYNYEEYQETSEFLINYNILGDNDIGNTKLYFKGDELKYVKTTGLKGEELSKISINYNVDESLFEIPSEYTDANQVTSENTQE